MKIRIFTDVNDIELKSRWDEFVSQFDYFPQSAQHWCATWWKHYGSNRSLYIAAALDDSGRIQGIAPLCIEQRFSQRILTSFPIHFGDFYTFIVSRELDYSEIIDCLLNHLLSFADWDTLQLNQVNSDDPLCKILEQRAVSSKKLTDCVVAQLSAKDWPDYLSQLRRNLRKDVRKKIKRLENNFNVEFVRFTDSRTFRDQFDLITEMYNTRWADNYRPERSEKYLKCFHEAAVQCFNDGDMILFFLKADDQVIGYRLGFVKEEVFYDWKTSYAVEWEEYSPGRLSIAYVIQDLLKKNFKAFHFMAGCYDYKLSWAPNRKITTNFQFLAPGPKFRSKLYSRYQLQWRDQIKKIYHRFLLNRTMRSISRAILRKHTE